MKTYTNKRIDLKKVTKTLFVASGILFFAYVFILGNTIFDVVARKVAEKDSRDLLAEISSLELSAFDLYNDLSLEEAGRLGFVESNPHFASRSLFVVR
ncbi:hypothetical protein GW765_00460 [Candidatus Parcubacteria bacterium]|nr:hypothetical protein [Candidatus Parcubacteria bacterium]